MVKVKCDFAKKQIKKKSSKVVDCEKQHDLALAKLKVVVGKMDGLDQQASSSKLLIIGLLH
jgi:hypothetical protein